MSTQWTKDAVLALAPDSSSAKAGAGLARPAKWPLLALKDQAVWGLCQGSGSKPYQTQIDLTEPAFRCSCPSRKFPCKHGIGLFLLLIEQPKQFKEEEIPEWVSSWLESRASRVDRREAKKQAQQEAAADPAAQAKRADQRMKRVTQGLADLEVWLQDLVRQGLSSAPSRGYDYWDTASARLVDAQAPTLARRIAALPSVIHGNAQWADALLGELADIHLLLEGFKRIDQLPEPLQVDLRTAIGWPQREEDVNDLPSEKGRWLVLGDNLLNDGYIDMLRTWLINTQTLQYALLMQFAPTNVRTVSLDRSLVTGMLIDADLVFFPSNYPLRALLRERTMVSLSSAIVQGFNSLDEGLEAYAQALAKKPWLEQFPMLIEQAWIDRLESGYIVRDSKDTMLPLVAGYDGFLAYAQQSRGLPCKIFGEWSRRGFEPLSIFPYGAESNAEIQEQRA